MISNATRSTAIRSVSLHASHSQTTSEGMTARARLLVWLSLAIALLAVIAAAAGLFWQSGSSNATVTSVHGETVELYGQGLYRNDSRFRAGGNQGTDTLTLVLGIPLLVASTWLYRRGSRPGQLMLLGTLVYFLYVYASLSLGTAYNSLFLIYVAIFSASLFAVILAFNGIDVPEGSTRLPRIGPALFMFASSLITLAVWLVDLLGALIGGMSPTSLEHSTTLVTHALDMAIIVPAAAVAGMLILRRDVLGYRIAMSLLVLEVMLAPMIALQTIFQLAAGVSFTTAEIAGPIGGFVVLALLALWVMLAILRGVAATDRDHGITASKI
jgi:hypothetical protein